MAELTDGNRVFERAYVTRKAAELAVADMIIQIRENTEWNVVPVIEEMELVDA